MIAQFEGILPAGLPSGLRVHMNIRQDGITPNAARLLPASPSWQTNGGDSWRISQAPAPSICEEQFVDPSVTRAAEPGSLSQLAPGSVVEASFGEDRYAICNVGGRIHALAGACPHRGGPLGQGAINGADLTCPWHGWEFDCRTGVHDYNPAVQVATFPVRVVGDDILIDTP